MASDRISVIVPTLNEAENIPLLLPRVAAALEGRDWEIILVDDNSHDNTQTLCAELAQSYPLTLLVRTEPVHGLSGAVLHGFAHATGDVLVVMDADLQHPPEKLPELIGAVAAGAAEFALGSRYELGGSMEESWGAFRRLNSSVATLLARPFAGGVKDPMSGFFALRRSTFERAERLSPLGYKIALELICKCRIQSVREIPIHFGLRQRGQSKLSLKQQFHYLQHLSRLYDFSFPRLAPMVKFLIVLAIGFTLGVVAFALSRSAGWPLPVAALVAYLIHLGVTALFHLRYIRVQREFLLTPRPWFDFSLVSLVELLVVGLSAAWLNWRMKMPRGFEVLMLSFLAGTLVRYVLRKEFFLDVRGLRHELRADEIRQ